MENGVFNTQFYLVPVILVEIIPLTTNRIYFIQRGENKTRDNKINWWTKRERDHNDLYDLKALTVNQLKDELRERSLPLTGLKPELVSRLSDALTVEHDLGDDNKEELDEALEDENIDED